MVVALKGSNYPFFVIKISKIINGYILSVEDEYLQHELVTDISLCDLNNYNIEGN